jgi:TetR/AcrR family transcriptional regulator
MMEQPKQRDADRSRAAILDAAERLFAEHGFDAVTMAQVGAAAGVSRGTPGYFFGTKEALYRVVIERAAATFRILAETLRARDAAVTREPAARLGETVDAFLALLTSRTSLVKLIDRENGIVSGEPHAEALRDALEGLGDDRDRVALVALAMCWFPVSHSGAARLLGVDASAPGFAQVWRDEVLAAVGVAERASKLRQVAPDPPSRETPAAAAETVDVAPPAGVPEAPTAHEERDEPPKKKKKKKKKKS